MNQLAFSKASHLAIRERLLADDPDLDEQTLADTVEGLTDLNEVIAAIVRAAVTDEAFAEGLRGRINEMQTRLSRFEHRAIAHRRVARDVMVETAIQKIMVPDLTISLRSGRPALQIIDEAAIPPDYWVTPEPRLDRLSLAAELKRGVPVSGACLGNAEPVLSVRAK
jgi:hypothetical protein